MINERLVFVCEGCHALTCEAEYGVVRESCEGWLTIIEAHRGLSPESVAAATHRFCGWACVSLWAARRTATPVGVSA
jgi:hypothetical protein